MIVDRIAYGISITDGYGQPLEAFEPVRDLATQDPYKNLPWRVRCSTVEQPWLVLGIEAVVNKRTDFAALHAQWEEAVKQAPQEIQALLRDLPEPDVVFMSGES